MPDLSGNPHAGTDMLGVADWAAAGAMLAVAWELRTANLIALRGAQAADDPDIKARLGVTTDPTTSPY